MKILLAMTGIKPVKKCSNLIIGARVIDSLIREHLPHKQQVNRYGMFSVKRLEQKTDLGTTYTSVGIKQRKT